jgi:hypothetical protein
MVLFLLHDRNIPEEVEIAEFWADAFAGSVAEGDNPMKPTSDILYPVVNNLDRIQQLTTTDNKEAN